jgi:hypothetical protein
MGIFSKQGIPRVKEQFRQEDRVGKKWLNIVKIISLSIILQQFIFLFVYIRAFRVDKINYHVFLIFFFFLVYIAFAIGLFMLKEWVRKSFVVFQIGVVITKILLGINAGIIVALKFSRTKDFTYFLTDFWVLGLCYPDYFVYGLILPFSFAISVILIGLFTHPKLKQQFSR